MVRGKGLDAADILVVLGAAIYLAYIFKLAGNFPKYHAAMLPLWAVASGVLVARVAGHPTLAQYIVALAGIGVLVWWFPTRLEDAWTIVWEETLNGYLIIRSLVLGFGIAILWTVAGLWGRRSNLLGALPVALLVLTLSWSASLAYVQRDRKGSSTYYYGRIGQHEAADAVSALLRPDEVYVAAKEVAWYASQHHYVDQDTWQHVTWDLNGANFDGTFQGHPIRILALEVGEESFRWAYDVLLLRNGYQHAGQYGKLPGLREAVDGVSGSGFQVSGRYLPLSAPERGLGGEVSPGLQPIPPQACSPLYEHEQRQRGDGRAWLRGLRDGNRVVRHRLGRARHRRRSVAGSQAQGTRARIQRRHPGLEESAPPRPSSALSMTSSDCFRASQLTLQPCRSTWPPSSRSTSASTKLPGRSRRPDADLRRDRRAHRRAAHGPRGRAGIGQNPFSIIVPCHRVVAAAADRRLLGARGRGHQAQDARA